MNELSYEELVSVLGVEAADEIQAQREAQKGKGGNGLPLPMLKKISDVLGNDLGNFSEFVVGAEKDKDSGAWTDKGTNYGKEFEFIIVNVCYYYKRFVNGAGPEGKGRTFTSNIFKSLSEIPEAKDYNGEPLPARKEEKKALGWKLVRVNAGLVRGKDGSEWKPCIWEVDGSMLFGFNNVIDGASGNGLLSTIMDIKAGHDKRGATPFVVIKPESGTLPLPTDIFKTHGSVISDITMKMKAYQESHSGADKTPKAPATQSESTDSSYNGSTSDTAW